MRIPAHGGLVAGGPAAFAGLQRPVATLGQRGAQPADRLASRFSAITASRSPDVRSWRTAGDEPHHGRHGGFGGSVHAPRRRLMSVANFAPRLATRRFCTVCTSACRRGFPGPGRGMVEAAAEGVELHEFKPCRRIRRAAQAGMYAHWFCNGGAGDLRSPTLWNCGVLRVRFFAGLRYRQMQVFTRL